jgi:hypothetical protein
MTAAWIDLWEAIKLVAGSGGVEVDRYQPGDRERLLPFAEKLEGLLQSGEVKAVGLNRKQERCEIAPDEWSRVTICWSDGVIGYGSQRHRFSPIGRVQAPALGGKLDWLPPLDPGSRHPGLIDDNGRLMMAQPIGSELYTMIRLARSELEKLIDGKKPGRPPEYRWDEMEAYAMDLLRKHGAPASENRKLQTQADLEAAILGFYSKKYDQEPSPSSLRNKDRLPQWIKNYKSEIAS